MAKIKIILIFLLLTAAGVVFQNCGRHNPDSIKGVRVTTLGEKFVGKSYLLYRIVREDGSEELYNQEKVETVTDVYMRFDSGTEVSGRDGCNFFSGNVVWAAAPSPDEFPQIEFFNMKATSKGCAPAPPGFFQPHGLYFYDVHDDLFRLIETDSSEMFEFAELEPLE